MHIFLFTLFLSTSMQMQDTTRTLLLFGKSESAYKEQLALLKDDTVGMAERDLVIVTMEKEHEYKEYKVAHNSFALILIGKDGGEKLRSTKPVELETIFSLIDSMPMRKAEMRQRKD